MVEGKVARQVIPGEVMAGFVDDGSEDMAFAEGRTATAVECGWVQPAGYCRSTRGD